MLYLNEPPRDSELFRQKIAAKYFLFLNEVSEIRFFTNY